MTAQRVALAIFALCFGCGWNDPARFAPSENDRLQSANDSASTTTDAAEVVRAAIEAHGGAANFAKADIGRTTMFIEGTFQPGVSGQFLKIDVFHLPDKLKRIVNGKGNGLAEGEQLDMVTIINGERAWLQMAGGEPAAIPIVNPGQGVYPADSLNLLIALESPEFQLSLLPADKIDGKAVHCVRTEIAGEWMGDLFFDKETHLPVASKKELFDTDFGGLRSIETYYSAYEIVDGLNLPMSIEVVVDGETMLKIKVLEATFLDGIDEEEFAKPVAQN